MKNRNFILILTLKDNFISITDNELISMLNDVLGDGLDRFVIESFEADREGNPD